MVGLILGGAVFYVTRPSNLMIVLIIGVVSLFGKNRGPGPEYYQVSRARKAAIGAVCFAILFIMSLGLQTNPLTTW